VYVLDRQAATISQFDRDGQLLASFGSQGSGADQLLAPRALALAPDGRIFVADTGNDRVQVFSSAGAFLQTFGLGSGSEPGQFSSPSGLAIEGNTLFIADTGNDRIQEVQLNGVLGLERAVNGPRGLAAARGIGLLVASPAEGMRAVIRNQVTGLADFENLPSEAALGAPVDVSVSGDGVLLADAARSQVVVLEPNLSFRRVVAGLPFPPIAVSAGGRDEIESVLVADGKSVREFALDVESPLPAFEALRSSLAAGDIEAALQQIYPSRRDLFRSIYQAIDAGLAAEAAAMQDVRLLTLREDRALLLLRRQETFQGRTVTNHYLVKMVRPANAAWLVYDY
jgi:hypothetical protein